MNAAHKTCSNALPRQSISNSRPDDRRAGEVPGQARARRPLVLIWGMLNSEAAGDFIAPFAGIVHRVVTLTIPDEENAIPAQHLAETARRHKISAETADSLEDALRQAAQITPALAF